MCAAIAPELTGFIRDSVRIELSRLTGRQVGHAVQQAQATRQQSKKAVADRLTQGTVCVLTAVTVRARFLFFQAPRLFSGRSVTLDAL